MNYEIAMSNDPAEVATAVQKALISSMEEVLREMKAEFEQPGLTWEQIDFFLTTYKNKKPTIVIQEEPM